MHAFHSSRLSTPALEALTPQRERSSRQMHACSSHSLNTRPHLQPTRTSFTLSSSKEDHIILRTRSHKKLSKPAFKRSHAYSISCDASSADRKEFRPAREDEPDHSDFLQLLRERSVREDKGPGKVYLVGTGPGDPSLLTLGAYNLMQRADVVLYDRLCSDEILSMVSDSARMVYVGKRSGLHTRTQEEIHVLLQEFAEAGAVVLRLKGGDPSIFGRGGEEMEYLRALGIEVKLVPGITASQGIGAALGIPLTLRGVADSVTFLTGHSKDGDGDPISSIESLASPLNTLVVYMGLQTLPIISKTLLDPPSTSPHPPMDPLTPAAAIMKGTTPEQRLVFAPLKDLSQAVVDAELVSPTLVIIGHVVAASPLWEKSGGVKVYEPEDVELMQQQVGEMLGELTTSIPQNLSTQL